MPPWLLLILTANAQQTDADSQAPVESSHSAAPAPWLQHTETAPAPVDTSSEPSTEIVTVAASDPSPPVASALTDDRRPSTDTSDSDVRDLPDLLPDLCLPPVEMGAGLAVAQAANKKADALLARILASHETSAPAPEPAAPAPIAATQPEPTDTGDL